MIRTFQYKLYPTIAQGKTLEQWLATCCWVYNQALEHRIKSYKRRKEPNNYISQALLLTKWRAGIERIRNCPAIFERDALRRVERAMVRFFEKKKSGQKTGFPRFKPRQRYNSMEYLERGSFVRGNRIRVPVIGKIRCRGQLLPNGKQKSLRVIRRASGWYAQIIHDDAIAPPKSVPVTTAIGIDLGLACFAALSNGQRIENPRFAKRSDRKLKAHQRRVSRRKRGSKRYHLALVKLRRQHEIVSGQRRSFCHQHSTSLVLRYDLIAVESLNIKGMVRSWLGKSIMDAAWSMFLRQLRVKAEWAGRKVVEVDPRGTSQECPDCGEVKSKDLSERVHRCECGCVIDRDVAASLVILSRALGLIGAIRPWTEPASTSSRIADSQAVRMKREVRAEYLCDGTSTFEDVGERA